MNAVNFYPGSLHISSYRDTMTQQRPEAFDIIANLALDNKVDIIIEIGTFHGGLALYLSDKDICDVHTFDIKDHNPSLPHSDRLFRYFNDSLTDECKNIIRSITQNKKTLWLFDGGDKTKEVSYYSDIIKAEEIVMAHDFAPNAEGFSYLKNNNIWLWHESDASAFDTCLFAEHKDFENIWKTAVWGAYVRR